MNIFFIVPFRFNNKKDILLRTSMIAVSLKIDLKDLNIFEKFCY